MARYKNGVQGSFSGKIGKVVGVTWRGIDVVRSSPRSSGRPPTQKQLDQRYIFKLVQEWLKPLRELIWIGYQVFKGNKTPMNAAVSFHMREAIVREAPNFRIDYAKAIFSRGELLISVVKEVTAVPGALVHIKWDNAATSAFCNVDDKASFIVYNPVKEKFVTFQNVRERAAKEATLQLPATFKDDAVHCWMGFVNVKGDMVSTTVYLGNISIS